MVAFLKVNRDQFAKIVCIGIQMFDKKEIICLGSFVDEKKSRMPAGLQAGFDPSGD